MATTNQNLSIYNPDEVPSGEGFHIGIVVASWNKDITENLLSGAVETLKNHGVVADHIHVRWVPGSFELPLGANFFLKHTAVDAVIVLGCVIQGETRHFDFVCQGVTDGIMNLNLQYGKPVIFGVLTDNHKQQSIDRSGGKHGNKGIECAVSALKMIALRRSFLI